VGLLCKRLGIPCVQFVGDLPHRIDIGAPPGPHAVVPTKPPATWARMTAAWSYHLARSVLAERREKRHGAMRGRALRLAFRTLRARVPSPVRVSYTAFPFGLNPRLSDVPELVFTASSLDFPRENRRNVHWLGPLVQKRRPATAFPFERLHPQKRLVYCALGSEGDDPAARERALNAVLSAMDGLPDHQLVLVRGAHSQREIASRAGVVEVSNAPQLELLQRASLAIFHGGFNTLRECMTTGVPMVVVPINPSATDRPRNGALTEYLGLGRCCPVHELTAARLRECILAAEDQSTRQRCRRVRDQLEASRAEDERRAVSLVERFMADA